MNVQASDGIYMDKVEVTWSAPSGATSYTVYRAGSSSPWALKKSLGSTSETFFNDTTAVPKTTYYYYVKASNAYGTSDYSSYDVGYRSDGSPAAPTNVSASDGIYMDKVEVTWSASSGATSYTVYRATSPTRWARKAVLGTTSGTSFNDTTAVPKTSYYYYVTTSNAYGTSNFSSYDTGYRSDGTPPPPTNVSASDGTYMDKVEVAWSASSGATSYTVYRATSPTRWARKTVLGTTSGTSFNDSTATPGRTYYYCVKATNGYGMSDFSVYDAGSR
jgi:cellulose 1,4-beta-cellobiosidase